MKILLAHSFYQHPGGEEAVFAMEAAFLREQGNQVYSYTVDNRAIRGMHSVEAAGKALWNREVYRDMRRLIKVEAPDVLHVHNTWPLLSPSVYWAAQSRGVPVVQTLHNYRLFCPSSTHFYRDGGICEDCLGHGYPYPGVLHACYLESRPQTFVLASVLAAHRVAKTWNQRVAIYIALTDFARRKYIQGGLPALKIIVKPNALHPDPGAHTQGTGEYVLFAGRIGQEKGILTLLQAWRHLGEIPLKIVGDGPLFDQAQSSILSEQSEKTELIGRKKHARVLSLMKGARFLVFPSEWYEGLPMTIVEAFACGIPVIASRLGTMAEIIADGHTGLHFTPGDAEDLALKVDWAWRHPGKMAQMGINARREYEEKYTAEKNYKRLIEIYQTAISSRKGKE